MKSCSKYWLINAIKAVVATIEPNVLVGENDNLVCNNNNLDDIQAEYPVKSSLSFWRRGHGNSAVVLPVSLLLERASQSTGYIDDKSFLPDGQI